MKNQMTLFVKFALNYNHNFIRLAFTGTMADHLKAKWDAIGQVMDSPTESYGRMVKFWTELSDDNRDILTHWINKNYKG